MALVFNFTGDASGSPDLVTIPASIPTGFRRLTIIPPVGHAWTFYDMSDLAGSVGAPMTVDQSFDLVRDAGEGAFVGGEVVAAVALDTGSGTFKGVLR